MLSVFYKNSKTYIIIYIFILQVNADKSDTFSVSVNTWTKEMCLEGRFSGFLIMIILIQAT